MASRFAELHRSVWSAWSRRRHRAAFDQVSSFCLFVGYPRSGHSLVGAMVNAHRHAVIAHELQAPALVLAGCDRDTLYAHILARAAWFNLRGNTSNYLYQIPGQWQGRFERLQVVGDKRGGSAAQTIDEHPDFLDRLAATVRVPLRLVHVVRNPFDNIAAIALWHGMSIDDATAYYFRLCRVTARLAAAGRHDFLTLHHEDVVRSPQTELARLCRFLQLETDAGYLAACASVTAETPSHTRSRVPWTAAQIAEVTRRASAFPYLAHHGFEIAGGGDRRQAPAREGRPARPMLWPRAVLRWFPTEPRPPALAAPAPPPATAGTSVREVSRYWNETLREARRAGPRLAWYGYMRGVYRRLVRDWLPAGSEGFRLKTDLFEEAVSAEHPLADLRAPRIGLDVSLAVARRARERLVAEADLTCLVADLRAIPLRDAALHGILSGSSLDHFPTRADLRAGFAELARILAPGGTLVLTLDNPHNPVVWLRNHLPFRLLKACRLVPYRVGETLGSRAAARALRDLGLRVVETRAVAHAPRAPAIWMVRACERLGWRTAGLSSGLAAFEALGRWPTRYLTGYYLALRVVRGPVELGRASPPLHAAERPPRAQGASRRRSRRTPSGISGASTPP